MTQQRRVGYILIVLLLCFASIPSQAQTDGDCPAIVVTALETVDEVCSDTARNEACYGHNALLMVPRAGVTEVAFEQPGDITGLEFIEILQLEEMDVSNNTWGVALLKMQANLPDTMPGQNVTFLLFGDVMVTNGVAAEDDTLQPMQAFYFNTGIGDQQCNQAPESGILIQTPEGTETVQLTANGVDIELGSTAFLQSTAEYMDIFLLENQAVVSASSVSELVPAGDFIRIPLGVDGKAIGPPQPAMPYEDKDFSALPLSLLPREIVLLSADAAADAATDGQPPAVIYTVKRGETLYSIGRCFETHHLDIVAANNIVDRGLIYVGQQLIVPTAEGTVPPTVSNKACALPAYPAAPVTPVDPVTDAPVVDSTVCDLNWCYEGQPWVGQCDDPNPLMQDWQWTLGWYEACYEAGFISSIPSYISTPPDAGPAPQPFVATLGCGAVTAEAILNYARVTPGDTLTYSVPGCGSGNVTASNTSGSIVFPSCISSTGGWIENPTGYKIFLSDISC
jgi:LysM repeat protein